MGDWRWYRLAGSLGDGRPYDVLTERDYWRYREQLYDGTLRPDGAPWDRSQTIADLCSRGLHVWDVTLDQCSRCMISGVAVAYAS